VANDSRPGDGETLPHASGASAQIPPSFRSGLTPGAGVVDTATWAGSMPAATGVAPRLRLGSRWFNLLWLLPIGLRKSWRHVLRYRIRLPRVHGATRLHW